MENLLFLFILVLLCIVLYWFHRNSNTRLVQKHKSTSSAKPQAKNIMAQAFIFAHKHVPP
jgi:uncharacterized protein (UPF0333 family)